MHITVCYDGGGWTFPYMAGVTKYMQEHDEHTSSYCGISAGSCVGLAAALGVPMDTLMSEFMKWAPHCRWCPWLTVRCVRDVCDKMIRITHPDVRDGDPVELRRNFAVGVSELGANAWLHQVLVKSFPSKEHLVEVMGSACSLPFVNTWGVGRRFDGGLTARFFLPPWPTDRMIRLSTCNTRRGATHTCETRIPWWRSIVPYDDDRLTRLYHQGYADGPRILGDHAP